jgi:hypothetical protein
MRASRCGALLLALLVGGCSTAPIVLPAAYTPARAKGQAAPLRGACMLNLAGVRDVRPDPDYSGEVAGRPVVGTHLGSWMTGGLGQLLAPQGDATLRVEVDLTKAYFASLNVAKSANLVVRARFFRDGALRGEETLRGADTSTNWASGEAETQAALRAALHDLAQHLRTAADRHCT